MIIESLDLLYWLNIFIKKADIYFYDKLIKNFKSNILLIKIVTNLMKIKI